jgi:hypothetical protein
MKDCSFGGGYGRARGVSKKKASGVSVGGGRQNRAIIASRSLRRVLLPLSVAQHRFDALLARRLGVLRLFLVRLLLQQLVRQLLCQFASRGGGVTRGEKRGKGGRPSSWVFLFNRRRRAPPPAPTRPAGPRAWRRARPGRAAPRPRPRPAAPAGRLAGGGRKEGGREVGRGGRARPRRFAQKNKPSPHVQPPPRPPKRFPPPRTHHKSTKTRLLTSTTSLTSGT